MTTLFVIIFDFLTIQKLGVYATQEQKYMADLMVLTPALDYCSISRNSRITVDDERCHFDEIFDIM